MEGVADGCKQNFSTVSVDQEIDNAAYVERVARTLSACFGGATASPVRGYWVSDSGELVKESTTMVFAYCSSADAEKYIDDVDRKSVV